MRASAEYSITVLARPWHSLLRRLKISGDGGRQARSICGSAIDGPMTTIFGATIVIGAGLYIFLRVRGLGREEAIASPPV
jgi:hypothetical protein